MSVPPDTRHIVVRDVRYEYDLAPDGTGAFVYKFRPEVPDDPMVRIEVEKRVDRGLEPVTFTWRSPTELYVGTKRSHNTEITRRRTSRG